MATEHATYCRICVAGCGIIVTTEDDTVLGVRGNHAHVLSEGYTCPKGRALPALHHHADRLDRPSIRRHDTLVDATWDDCLDDVGARVRRVLDEHGPSAVGYFVGSGGYFDAAGLYTSNRLMRTLATPSYYSDTSIDVISTMVVSELVSGMPGLLAKPDLDENRLLIIVGSNPVVSHGQTLLMPNPIVRLRQLTTRGELWVIDPRRTETARLATGHLQARPGTDHAIFGFLVRELLRAGADHKYLDAHATGVNELTAAVERFDRAYVAELSGVTAEHLQQLLDSVRRAGRVAVLTGTGSSMANDANVANWLIWALEIITHSADQPGGVSFTPGFFAQWDRNDLPPSAPTGTRAPGPASRPELSSWLGEYPCAAMADEIEAGNLRALFVAGGNIALNLPNHPRLAAALRRLEVLVVADVITTETTELATHVWPCTGQLERADLTMIHDVLMPRVMCQHTSAVVAPAAERRPMWWAFAQLGRRIGIDVLPDIDLATACDDDVLDLALKGARLGLDELRAPGAAGQPVETDRAVFGWVHERVLRDGRWQLAPPELVRQLDEVRRPASLVLIPQRQVRHQNTQHRRLGDRPYVQINPVDAATVHVADGDQVMVSSATGSVTGTAFVTDVIRAGAVSVPHGWADPCVNTLVSDRDVDPLTGMPRQSGTPVALTRAVTNPDKVSRH